ncbi:BlaI/MecI/CopY family transcriptional regulator [Hellea sp.]|nr:BlaI/MecI/CopY family transcriptional regulator [Hellea sp.]
MKKISQSELVIMDSLWEEAPMGASEIADKVSSEGWNIRTIKTLLSRLVQKGILSTEPDGRRYLYTPLMSKEAYGAQVLDGISKNFYGGRTAPLFLHLAKQKDLSDSDIDEISSILERLKAEKDKSS